MTDEEIIHKYVDLSDSCLNKKDKIKLLKVLCKHKKAFSLRDEIGECPYMEVELELNDTKPFFIKPYPIREEHKAVIDKEMRRGVLLGILKKFIQFPSNAYPKKNHTGPKNCNRLQSLKQQNS